MKEDRAQTKEMGGMETQFQCGLYVSTLGIDTPYRREVSFVDPMAPIGTIGSHCRRLLRIDIKGFQCFDHCLTKGHLRGTPWSLVGKPRREQTSGQTIKGHAADMSIVQAIAIDGGRCICPLSPNQVRSQFPLWEFGTFVIELA